jgi:hypothetical protein
VLRTAQDDPLGLQVHPNGLVLDPDAGLLGHVVGQTVQRPQRERQPQAPRTATYRLHQALAIVLRHLARRARVGRIAQSLDPLSQVALEPAPYRLLALTHYLGDLGGRKTLLGRQQDHLGARPEARLGGAIQLF